MCKKKLNDTIRIKPEFYLSDDLLGEAEVLFYSA